MQFAVIGLGSMGRRRIRCLNALGYFDIVGIDTRKDRRNDAVNLFGIKTYASVDGLLHGDDKYVFIISVPPDKHDIFINLAIEHNYDFFVEASVLDDSLEEIKSKLRKSDIVAAPSSTLSFHPAIKIIKELIKRDELGVISNIILHSGQYLPDWHSYEEVSEYYVSNRETGGAREIVPFELTWLTDIFGMPKSVGGNFRKTVNIKGAEKIDDTYNCLLDYDKFLMVVTVDVVSRYATRRLLINGDKKQLVWNWDESFVNIYDSDSAEWKKIEYVKDKSADGYNQNISESMYIEEVRSFINSVKLRVPFVNTIEKDHKVLKLLYCLEESNNSCKFVQAIQ